MKRLAIYPGSFDPPTFGHVDIIERASRLFDEVVVAVGVNSKKTSVLSVEQRIIALSEIVKTIPNVKVESFDGLLMDYAREKKAKSVVRGLRAVADFEYEFQIAMVNRKLNPAVDTVFLMTSWEFSYLSSSVVREVATHGGNLSDLVPAAVAQLIHQVMNERRAAE